MSSNDYNKRLYDSCMVIHESLLTTEKAISDIEEVLSEAKIYLSNDSMYEETLKYAIGIRVLFNNLMVCAKTIHGPEPKETPENDERANIT